MHIPLKGGILSTPIGIDEVFQRCPSCEVTTHNEILVSAEYSHIWYIPIFPDGKTVSIVCKKCGLRRPGLSFNAKNINNYEEIKHQFNYPWWTFSIAGLFGFIALISLLFAIFL